MVTAFGFNSLGFSEMATCFLHVLALVVLFTIFGLLLLISALFGLPR